jgi:adenosine kinase
LCNLQFISLLTLVHVQTFILNLSAPFVAQFFTDNLKRVLPYTDVIIGNESEAEAWATATGYSGSRTDLAGIAKALAGYSKANSNRERVVIFTHGSKATTLVAGPNTEAKTFSVKALSDDEIVDTNGAGDAFAGGFLGAYVAGKTLEDCVLVGHELGRMCVKQVCAVSLSERSWVDFFLPSGRPAVPVA